MRQFLLPSLLVPTLLVLSACQEPFAEDRHDLASFRIAAVAGTLAEAGGVQVHAAVWSGLGPYHDTLPSLDWSSDTLAATGQDAALAVTYPARIGLVASDGDATETAALDLAAAPVPIATSGFIPGFTRRAVALDIAQVTDPIADRLAVEPGDDAPIAVSSAVRLTFEVPEGVTVHWMGTGGTFAELDAHSTDWFAGDVVLDDNEIDSTSTIDAGVYNLLALAFDGVGNTAWMWIDVAVGLDGPLLYTDGSDSDGVGGPGGRIFAVDAEPMSGVLAVDVVQDDGAAGIALENVRVADAPADGGGDPAASPACTLAGLAEGGCTRADLVGTTLTVQGEVR